VGRLDSRLSEPRRQEGSSPPLRETVPGLVRGDRIRDRRGSQLRICLIIDGNNKNGHPSESTLLVAPQLEARMGVDNLVLASGVVAASVGVGVLLKHNSKNSSNLPLPPGPPGKALVGHTDLPKFDDFDTYKSWADKYGQ